MRAEKVCVGGGLEEIQRGPAAPRLAAKRWNLPLCSRLPVASLPVASLISSSFLLQETRFS